MLSYSELRRLPAKRVQVYQIPKDAIYLGCLKRPYGDEFFYRLNDGSYVYYYSLVD